MELPANVGQGHARAEARRKRRGCDLPDRLAAMSQIAAGGWNVGRLEADSTKNLVHRTAAVDPGDNLLPKIAALDKRDGLLVPSDLLGQGFLGDIEPNYGKSLLDSDRFQSPHAAGGCP